MDMLQVESELRDQASQILYFESSESNEDVAFTMLFHRLLDIYRTGYQDGIQDGKERAKWESE